MTIPKTMRAMVLEAPKQPLKAMDAPVPQPDPGHMLLRVHAAGGYRGTRIRPAAGGGVGGRLDQAASGEAGCGDHLRAGRFTRRGGAQSDDQRRNRGLCGHPHE